MQNYRSILDETLECDQLTALVGANGSGKSSFLKAMDLFYSSSPRYNTEDFYNRDTEKDIEITITFTGLTDEEKERFSNYLEGEYLTVVRVLSLSGNKCSDKYHGSSLQNYDFSSIREKTKAAERKTTYEELRQKQEYSTLPRWTKQEDALEYLKEWEIANPQRCTRQRDDGQFFGFKEVAQGYLGQYTRFIFIPAVRNAADDANESKGSVITEIMDLVVRTVLANRQDIKNLKDETQKRYEDIMDPANLTELRYLSEKLTSTLSTYVPNASVYLSWIKGSGIDIPLPKADVKLIEDGYPSTVAHTGHGLQRAFILTMLQHLAVAHTPITGQEDTKETVTTADMPNLILGIEEPEVYQHPSRQRHFSNVLLKLASGAIPGVAQHTQVIYCTHSPLFVGIDRFNQVRILHKNTLDPDKPKVSKIISTTLDQVAEDIWEAFGKPEPQYTGKTLRPRLHTLMTPWMSEGFFADVVVLVEGEDDRAAILGVAKSMGYDLESNGFSIIPCGGKTNLDRPTAIFRLLGIPVYVIWDSDQGIKNANLEENHNLLRLMGKPVTDWPSEVSDNFACFATNLEKTLSEEIGPTEFEQWLQEFQETFGIPKRKHAIKNPSVISAILEEAKRNNKQSPALEKIVNKIIGLKKP